MTPAIVENAYQDSFSSRSKVTLGRQGTEKAAKKNLLMQRNLKHFKQDNDAVHRSKTAGMSMRSTSFSTRRPNDPSRISLAKLT